MTEANPEPIVTEEVKDTVPEVAVEAKEEHNDEEKSAEMVPVSALQKERKKRQQYQQRVEYLESQKKETQEEDYTKYESVTKEDLSVRMNEIKRDLREENWRKEFPERASYVEQNLEDFLTKRPNLALAITPSGNRLEEAWELMTKLAPPKAKATQSPPSREAPKSPGTVPKGAALNEAVNLMKMSDSEFKAWRASKRQAR